MMYDPWVQCSVCGASPYNSLLDEDKIPVLEREAREEREARYAEEAAQPTSEELAEREGCYPDSEYDEYINNPDDVDPPFESDGHVSAQGMSACSSPPAHRSTRETSPEESSYEDPEGLEEEKDEEERKNTRHPGLTVDDPAFHEQC